MRRRGAFVEAGTWRVFGKQIGETLGRKPTAERPSVARYARHTVSAIARYCVLLHSASGKSAIKRRTVLDEVAASDGREESSDANQTVAS